MKKLNFSQYVQDCSCNLDSEDNITEVLQQYAAAWVIGEVYGSFKRVAYYVNGFSKDNFHHFICNASQLYLNQLKPYLFKSKRKEI